MTTANATIDLTTFRAHAAEHLERLAASGGVEYITVDGQTKGVVMAPDVYGRMADRIEQAETTESIRRGLADLAAGRVIPAEQAILDLAAELGLDMDIVTGRKGPGTRRALPRRLGHRCRCGPGTSPRTDKHQRTQPGGSTGCW